MSRVTLADNIFEPDTWETYEGVENVVAFIYSKYAEFPHTGRIYHNHVAKICDVTPSCDADIDRLEKLEGNFFLMVYPEDPITILIIVAVVLAAVSIGMEFLLRPSTNNNQNTASPNNSISDRQNTDRPNERIPDIFGTVRSTFDALAPPYRIFDSNQEIEIGFYCIGRGTYEFHLTNVDSAEVELTNSVWDIKDDATPISEEAGASVEVWGPNTSPNSLLLPAGTAPYAPQLLIGEAIGTQVYTTNASSVVVGQILRPPNDQSVTGSNSIAANQLGTLVVNGDNADGGTIDFTDYFAVGDIVTLTYTGATDPGAIQATVDLSGIYEAIAVETDTLTFANPQEVNSNWNALVNFSGGQSNYQSPNVSSNGSKWVGPWILNFPSMSEVWFNFVAPYGLFKLSSSSGTQYEIDVEIQVGIQAIDGNNLPVGEEIFFTCTVYGSAILQTQRATTLKCVLPIAGSCQVRAVRMTDTDNTWVGTNQDQVQWRDLYAVLPAAVANYGNVTTVMTQTYATASALSVKSRKLNGLVTRMLPQRDPVTFIPNPNVLVASDNAADIICAMAEDPWIGNRSTSEINYASIYATAGVTGTIAKYFGTPLSAQFGYTFDDANVSFEESLTDICQAICCQGFRRGNVLDIAFEQPTSVGTILFNHRNKIPGSETRTVQFGYNNDYDGIELDYIDPNAPNYPDIDTTVTLYYPADQSALSAKKIKLIGVRNNVQAALIGWRLYNKLLYQNTVTEFKTMKEAADCVLQDCILVVDNTRADVIDGEVTDQNGLILTLSQPVALVEGTAYTIYLQLSDGTIDAIGVTQGASPTEVILATAPTLPLNVDPTTWARTTYMIALPPNASEPYQTAQMLLTEKNPEDNQQYTLSAVNYDPRYYANDQDYANGIITLNGLSNSEPTGYGPPIPPSYVYIPLVDGSMLAIGAGQSVTYGGSIPFPTGGSYSEVDMVAWCSPGTGFSDPGQNISGVGAATMGAGVVTASFGGEFGAFSTNAAGNWVAALWTVGSTAVALTTVGEMQYLRFTTANGDVLCIAAGQVPNLGTMGAPSGFTAANMVSISGMAGNNSNGHIMQGVQFCDLSEASSGTINSNTCYNDNDGNQWGGPANVFCVFWNPGGGVTSQAVAGGTAILIPTTGTAAVALVQASAVAHGASFGVPTGGALVASTEAMAGWTAHGGSEAVGWTVSDTAGVVSALYQDETGAQYPGAANVFAVATI